MSAFRSLMSESKVVTVLVMVIMVALCYSPTLRHTVALAWDVVSTAVQFVWTHIEGIVR